jgi:uncharacterized protein (TIGR02646 family)
MIEIKSSLRETVHAHLQKDRVKNAFIKNIKDEKHDSENAYSDGKADDEDSIKWTLKQIYYEKCAYCESYIKNDFGEIEHFRPKNSSKNEDTKCDKSYSYYWLSFSWSNLIPSCKRCNGKKSNCFDILGTRASYNYEELEDLHFRTADYNDSEQPKLLHPEYDTFEDKICFNARGKIISKDERVKYTVKICDLNRKNLIRSRGVILTTLIDNLLKQYPEYEVFMNKHNNLKEALKKFKYLIEEFCKQADKSYEYSLIRKYTINNFESIINQNIEYEDKERKDTLILAFFTFAKIT